MDDLGRIRVMIVDDHYMVREGLKVFLSTSPDLEVVAEAETGREAVERCVESNPDVVLMDMVMPDMDGAAATAEITQACEHVRVIILTSFVEESLVTAALEAGAISYILKDSGPQKLAEAIREAHRGRGTVDGAVLQTMMHKTEPAKAADPQLTPRERQVLALLSEGLTNNEIAERLFLSAGTVRLHVSNILSKLGATNRTQAALMAAKRKLID